MRQDTTSEIRIADLAVQFMKEHREGRRPSIADYARAYPAMAETIRELFPQLIMLEGLAKDNRQSPRYSLLSGVKRPDVLGDYQVLQEIGAGGMGVVYEAEQISLARHVALKVLPFQLISDPHAIDRFRREARAAACLVHENIVPVYDVGEDDSVWYYAMQFIPGQSLQEVRTHLRHLICPDVEPADSQQLGQLSDAARRLLDERTLEYPETSTWVTGPAAFEHCETETGGSPDQLRVVVDECLCRRAEGETLTDEAVMAAHPELMPELREELRLLKLLEASRPPQLVNDLIELDAQLRPKSSANRISPSVCDKTTVVAQTTSVSELLSNPPESARHLHAYFLNLALLIANVADALDYAHHQGIVHRDIKPSNLLLDTRGRIWVTDFGLARITRTGGSTSGKMVGTLRYMSPEQVKGHCDPRSDVYSLGITLYEMATLRRAIAGNNFVDTIQRICHEGPTPPRQVEPRVPRDLERIIVKAIARNAEDRYQSANEFGVDLRRFAKGDSISAQSASLLGKGLRWCRRNLVLTVAVCMTLVAWCMMFYMWLVLQRMSGDLSQGRPAAVDSMAESKVVAPLRDSE